jgi:hypothetical protein
MDVFRTKGAAVVVTAGLIGLLAMATTGYADPMVCNMSGYKAVAGVSAINASDTLTVLWSGDTDQELRLAFGVTSGTPVLRELAIRRGEEGAWATLASNVTPELRIT